MPALNGQADVERTLASFVEDAPLYALIVDNGSTPPIDAPSVSGMQVEVCCAWHTTVGPNALKTDVEALAARGYRYAARINSGDLTALRWFAKQRVRMKAEPRLAAPGMWRGS